MKNFKPTPLQKQLLLEMKSVPAGELLLPNTKQEERSAGDKFVTERRWPSAP